MPPLFWLDVAALSISAVTTTSLTLMVLGLGPGRALNRAFVLFSLTLAAWVFSALLLRGSLWLGPALPPGMVLVNSQLWLELTGLFIALMPNFALGFTAHYLGRRSRWTDLGQGLGLLVAAAFSIPLFRHQLVSNPRLNAWGVVVEDLHAWGGAAAVGGAAAGGHPAVSSRYRRVSPGGDADGGGRMIRSDQTRHADRAAVHL